MSGESKYESADESFHDGSAEQPRRRRAMSRQSSIAKLVRQASAASINVYNRVFHRGELQRRRSSVRRKYGVDRQLIELVRERVLQLIEEEKKAAEKKSTNNNTDEKPSLVDDKDLLHIRETDILITRFLLEYFEDHPYNNEMCDEDKVANSVAPSIVDTLKWRKEMNINKMKDSDFPREFYACGLYGFGEDGDGRLVVYCNGKKARKFPQSFVPIVLKFGIYEAEKKLLELFGDPLNPKNPPLRPAVVCDCGGVSISQVDINLVLSLIPLIKYYPNTFEYVWCYDLPWMVRPFFNLVLKVMPNRIVKRVQQKDKKSAFNEMGAEGIPKFMGGTAPNPRVPIPPGASTIREVGLRNGISGKDIKAMEKFVAEITAIDPVDD